MFKRIIENKFILILIDIILLIVSIKSYKYIFDIELARQTFTNAAVSFVEENEKPVFKISKIVLYSSAYAVDHSDGQLQDIDISQFTDMAIYIDNTGKTEKITAENTVNEMFIDNIQLAINTDKGEHILNYKNPQEFGKYAALENYQEDGILFQIVHTNDEQIDMGNQANTFYTDCTNPITLGFVNQNLLTNCKIASVDGAIAFDGSILKNANVNLKDISGKISFTIHIKNNLGEDFTCHLIDDVNFEEDEEGIYTGYVMKIQNTEGQQYNFLKVSE